MTLLSVSRLVQMRNRQMRVMSFSLGAARQSMLRKSHVMPDLCIARVAYSRVMYKYHGLTCGTFAFQQIPSAHRTQGNLSMSWMRTWLRCQTPGMPCCMCICDTLAI